MESSQNIESNPSVNIGRKEFSHSQRAHCVETAQTPLNTMFSEADHKRKSTTKDLRAVGHLSQKKVIVGKQGAPPDL